MNVLITGGFGNIGLAMAEFLLKTTPYNVYLGHRLRNQASPHRFTSERLWRVQLDITDDANLRETFDLIQPDYLINLAAFTRVGPAWNSPTVVYDVNCLGVMRCLETIRKMKPRCKFFSAGTILQFANTNGVIDEYSAPAPDSIYGTSKQAAHDLVRAYRDKYGLYAVHAILGNNEGRYKGDEFVFQKVIRGVVKNSKLLKQGKPAEPITLGNIYHKRSWGDTDEFCEGIWKCLNQEVINKNFQKITDYVLSTNDFHSVKELVEYSSFCAGLPFEWRGDGMDEFCFTPPSEERKTFIVSKEFYREEKSREQTSSARAHGELNWNPKINFYSLIKKLVEFELQDWR